MPGSRVTISYLFSLASTSETGIVLILYLGPVTSLGVMWCLDRMGTDILASVHMTGPRPLS